MNIVSGAVGSPERKRWELHCARQAELRKQGKKLCVDCEEILPLSRFHVRFKHGEQETFSRCKRCHSRKKGRQGYNRKVAEGRLRTWGQSASNCLARAKKRSRARGLEYSLTHAWFISELERANYCCALSGVRLGRTIWGQPQRLWNSCSIHRVHNNGGYTPENCLIICTQMNIALGEWGEESFRKIAMGFLQRTVITELVDSLGG